MSEKVVTKFTFDSLADQKARLETPIQVLMTQAVVLSSEPIYRTIVENRVTINSYLGVMGLRLHLNQSLGYCTLQQLTDDNQARKVLHARTLTLRQTRVLACLALIRQEAGATPSDTYTVPEADVHSKVRDYLPRDYSEDAAYRETRAILDEFAERKFAFVERFEDGVVAMVRISPHIVEAVAPSEFDRFREEYAETEEITEGDTE